MSVNGGLRTAQEASSIGDGGQLMDFFPEHFTIPSLERTNPYLAWKACIAS
jgi:hypothetical protein